MNGVYVNFVSIYSWLEKAHELFWDYAYINTSVNCDENISA